MNFSTELLLLLPFFVCLVFLGCLGYFFSFYFRFGLSWQRRLCQRLLMPATAKCFSIYFSRTKKNNLLAPSVLAFYGALWPPFLPLCNCFGPRVSAIWLMLQQFCSIIWGCHLTHAHCVCARARQLAASQTRRRPTFDWQLPVPAIMIITIFHLTKQVAFSSITWDSSKRISDDILKLPGNLFKKFCYIVKVLFIDLFF